MAQIAVVEDDDAIATLVVDAVGRAGHDARRYADGAAAWRGLREHTPDLVVLDLMLPEMSGLDVCRRMRARPGRQPIVVMLTARVAEEDAVLGYEVGADAYVRKPFKVRELIARIDALLRLHQRGQQPAAAIELGALRIDVDGHRALHAGSELPLTPMELALLIHLARRPGEAHSRSELLREVWCYDHDGYARTVDSHVVRVRKKLVASGCTAVTIATVHGVGYRLDVAD